MNLFSKIALPVGLLVAVMVVLVFVAAAGLTRLSETTAEVVDVNARRHSELLAMQAAIYSATIQEKNLIIENDAAAIVQADQKLAAAKQHALTAADVLVELADSPERRTTVEGIRRQVSDYFAILDRSVAFSRAGDVASARALSTGEVRGARAAVEEMVASRVTILKDELAAAKALAAEEASSRLRDLVVAAVGGIALALAVLVAMLVGLVTRPIGAVTAAIQTLASGDLTVSVIGADRRDEVGRLARALQVFKDNALEVRRLAELEAAETAAKMRRAETLDGLTRSFETSVGRLTGALSASATEMEATAESMTTVADKTSRTASAVASAAQQTSANVQTVAAATEELATSVQEIAGQVHQSRSVTEQAVASARMADGRVRGLAEAADRIGAIVELISTIAGQTNLLALNATIEAARAGEAGRGFAVVAAEVKELANQTAKATGEISGQIAAIRNATGEVVHAIQEFGTIIGQVSQASTAIATAIEEQDSATAEISRNVQQAAKGTEDVTGNIGVVQTDAGRTGEAAGDVLEAARELARHSSELRREVDNFIAGVRAA